MLWDVFCRVIDNFGDIGVCWRLATDLGQRGHQVRLWVDDAQALSWMAPHVSWQANSASGQGQPGVSVHTWAEAEQPCVGLNAGDVVIEAFGCNPPDAFIALMHSTPTQWVNLEYLSAQNYVERSHGLRSPVWTGPGTGLTKRFFFPGFTAATGGLLREQGLIERIATFQKNACQRQEWLNGWGIEALPNTTWISVFCYASAPLAALLDHLAEQRHSVQVLLTPGHASHLARQWLASRGRAPEHVRLSELPALPQADYDMLLWCCDLNMVRGEDSAVRAIWAGRPHIWQIYEQDDGVHADKLDAFMQRWMADWPQPTREKVQALWRAWNGLGSWPHEWPNAKGDPCFLLGDMGSSWSLSALASRQVLLAQNDLATQLTQFVASSG